MRSYYSVTNHILVITFFMFSIDSIAHVNSIDFKNNMMNRTIRLAEQEVAQGGLPFATIIVNSRGDVVAEAVNTVKKTHDPTDHAEIRALRMLTSQIKKNEIHDYEVYVIGHPCVMCYSALMLARPKKVYFSVTLQEKNTALKTISNGIDVCSELGKSFSERAMPMEQLIESRQKALEIFKSWNQRNENSR
jgi:tRNA(Arg) A34 adenosine deaminase TadA